MSIYTRTFWSAATERAASTAAQAAITAIGADFFNAIQGVSWLDIAGFALGGAALSYLKSVAFGRSDGNPSATNAETTAGA